MSYYPDEKRAFDEHVEARGFDTPPAYGQVYLSQISYTQQLAPQACPISGSSLPGPFKPVVIPQISSSMRGAYFSPFSRAYSPVLAQTSISQSEFLSFIDGLNEAFIANAGLQVASLVGGVMSFVPFSVIPLIGIGVQVAAELATAGTSWARARSYVAAANETIFGPQGLQVKVLKTKKMMVAVGQEGAILNLPPIENYQSTSTNAEDDPRMRRIRALGDQVAPLVFTGLPPPEQLDSWWKQIGAKQAQRKDAKQQRKMMKKRGKAFEKWEKQQREAEEESHKYDEKIKDIDSDRRKEIAKAESKLTRKSGDPSKCAKIEADLNKDLRKLDRELEKVLREKDEKIADIYGGGEKRLRRVDKREQKVANKIYWIVVERIDVLEHQGIVEDDVESLDSKE